MSASLPCIVCHRSLENFSNSPNQPNNGLAFTSYGHYGSTAFDPMNGSFLELNICDPCLLSAAADQIILVGVDQSEPGAPPLYVWYPEG